MRVLCASAEFAPATTVGGLGVAVAGLVAELRRGAPSGSPGGAADTADTAVPAVVDVEVMIPAGYLAGVDREADLERFQLSPGGVVVIEKGRVLNPHS
jgi:hypothetical protein